MIPTKTKEEIEVMKEGGEKLGQIKSELVALIAPGVTLKLIDQRADELIKKSGGAPSFKMVPDYNWATCINVNDGVVHGIPGDTPLKNGDIVSLDVGLFYKGFHTDTSVTLPVGEINEKTKNFLSVGERALSKTVNQVKVGRRISDISRVMQEEIEKAGFAPVKSLTGHGIGKALHEEPQIPCFWEQKLGEGETIPEGAALAIEVIYTQCSPDLVLSGDRWTIETQDGKMAALFEETVAVTFAGPVILTA